MKRRMTRLAALALTLGACSADHATAPVAAPDAALGREGPSIQATWLPWGLAMVPGYNEGAAYSIDVSSNVAGAVWNGGGLTQAVVWINGGSPTIITPPAGTSGAFLQAQHLGTYVGAGITSAGVTHAMKATLAGGATLLDDAGYASSTATSISAPLWGAGWIVGSVEDAAGNDTPVRWSLQTGARTALPLPAGYVGGYASDVAANGQTVGTITDAGGSSRAYLWNSDGTGTFLAPAPSLARSISSTGMIAMELNGGGAVTSPPYTTYTVLWTGNVWDVNGLNRVVGNAGGSARTWRNGVVVNIAYPGATSSWPRSINSCGNIVGQARVNGLTIPVRWIISQCE
ncbi:MAG: hypothetical protein U0163_07860 [Gemmatimonadaceae bacterium]